jgi:spore coat polysaccharide biosynthesis protein SpsF
LRKLVACLACRNEGSRLFAKPLQNLDIKKNVTIIQYIIDSLKKVKEIDEIVLAISDKKVNSIYKDIAKQNNIKFIYGSDENVLLRLIKSCTSVKGTDIFRVTTESPFLMYEEVERAWKIHKKDGNDLTAIDKVPDGSGFEIIKLEAYKKSNKFGKKKTQIRILLFIYKRKQKKF